MPTVSPERIRLYRTTTTGCECPAYRFRRRGITECKHMIALKEAIAIVRASEDGQHSTPRARV